MTSQLEHVIKDNSNQAFIARFALVIAGLHLVVGSFGLIAYELAVRYEHPDPAQHAALISERIRPVARVATAATAGAHGAATQPAASAPPRAPATLLAQHCTACHATGVLGAPRIGDTQAWIDRERRAGGAEGLVRSALQGRNQMPPGGGVADLSADEARAVIALMRR